MAVLDVHFHSDALQVATAMTVILPERPQTLIGLAEPGPSTGRPSPSSAAGPSTGKSSAPASLQTAGPSPTPATGPSPSTSDAGPSPSAPAAADPPLLYLLHGLSDDETIWLRRTSIDRYASEKGLAVVMPRAGRSFYQDEVHGSAYWTFICQELPEVVHAFFRVSTRREDTFVAGLSMGGYGAMRWALTQPGRFAAAASLSGAVDLAARAGTLSGGALTGDTGPDADSPFLDFAPDVRDRVFGGHFTPGRDNDLIALLGRSDPATLPALWVSCGAQDDLLPHTEHFVAAARAAGVDPHVEYPDGVHEWGLWDAQIRRVLDWLPLR